MLVIPLLLTILLLTDRALFLGKARLGNAFNAENDAYGQVVSGSGFNGREVLPADDPTPPDGINAVKPELPNRYMLADEFQDVALLGQDNQKSTVRMTNRAILLDPAWHISSWPELGDRRPIAEWFAAYVGESHPDDVVYDLGLQPAGPP